MLYICYVNNGKQTHNDMTYNNTFALATAAIFSANGRCNDNTALSLCGKIDRKMETAPRVEALTTTGRIYTQAVTVSEGASSFVVVRELQITTQGTACKGYTIQNIF